MPEKKIRRWVRPERREGEVSTTYATETTLTTITCGECGGVYAIAEKFREQSQKEGTTWRCPYPGCHVHWGYANNSENAQLKRQLEAERQRVERAENRARMAASRQGIAERSARAYKGQVTKVKRRVGNGVCPCCNRTFSDLARHMKGKHPDYGEVAP
jgi:hypothetical protein